MTRVVEENLPQEEIQQIEACKISFINSIEQENAELKQINTKLAKEITKLKSEIQKYKFNEETYFDDIIWLSKASYKKREIYFVHDAIKTWNFYYLFGWEVPNF